MIITLRIDGDEITPPRGFAVALEWDIERGTTIYLTQKINGDVLGGGYFSRRYAFPLEPGQRLDIYDDNRLIASFVERDGCATDPMLVLSEGRS